MTSSHAPADLYVLHDVGDAGGGGPWREAFAAGGWNGRVIAPDLPGHAGAPPPIGGHHEFADGLLHALRDYRALALDKPVVVGVGVNGWSAWSLAIGGRASGLVLVDGLGGPWHTPEEAVALMAGTLREMSNDAAAMAPFEPGTRLDPRLRHFARGFGTRVSATRFAEATAVPTLLLHSPEAALSRDVADELAASFAGGVAVVDIADREPATVAAAVCAQTTRSSISWLTDATTEPSCA